MMTKDSIQFDRNLIETYAYGTSKDLVSDKDEIKYNNRIERYIKRLTLILLLIKYIKKHNPNWPEIPDHPYRILIIGGLDLEKQIHYLI